MADQDVLSSSVAITDEEEREATKAKPVLLSMDTERLGKWVRSRWDRLNKQEEERAVELKVNYLRWKGYPFVEAHPNDRSKLFLPPGRKNAKPQGHNRIERGVDRYVAQITVDEPLLEAIPGPGAEDEDDDATEAATFAIRGEWQRLNNNTKMKKRMFSAAIYRSAFVHYFWSPAVGSTQTKPSEGEDEEEKTPEPKGHIDNEELTAFQVRWSNGYDYAHDAPEVMIGRLVTLRDLFELYPEARSLKLTDLSHEPPPDASEYLEDLSGKSGSTEFREGSSETGPDDGDLTGEDLGGESPLLDRKVFHLIYYRHRSATYPEGFFCHVVGKAVPSDKSRGTLRKFEGRPPIAHYKFLHHPVDKYGRSLVDILRATQDMLDWVNGQVLRYLQSLRSRYFVHITTDVNRRDLESAQDTVIPWSGNQPPQRETPPQMPGALFEWTDRVGQAFADDLGIHESARGIHVPGVQSGEHVAQLRVGDETILGLTRDQMVEGLQQEGRVILRMIKNFWSEERQVAYFGRDKPYVARAFRGSDFDQTGDVMLVRGTLLMISPQQRAQIMSQMVSLNLLQPEEVRQFMPTNDVAGFRLQEDPHFMRARRQNERFLVGPPEEITSAVERIEGQMEEVASVMGNLSDQVESGETEADPRLALGLELLTQRANELEEQRVATINQVGFEHRGYESSPFIARTHFFEHAKALARARTRRFPAWWVELFERHAIEEGIIAGLVPNPNAPPQPQAVEGGGQQAQPAAVAG